MDMDDVIDPLDKAAYDTVHDYTNPRTGKKGAVGLGPVVGMPHSTLQNKVNPSMDFQHLTLKESRTLMLATGDHRMLRQLARDLGEACVPLPSLDVVGDLDVLEALTEWQAETGETAQKVRDIYADKRIELGEVEELRRELIEDFEKGLALLDRIRAQAEPAKPLRAVR